MKRQGSSRQVKETRTSRRSEREYRGPRYNWSGFTPVANWRANPAVAPRVYETIKELTASPVSSTVLRHADIKLEMIWNAKSTGARKKGQDDRIPFSATELHHSTGYARRICRECFRALSMAGAIEQSERKGHMVYRSRQITHEQADAFLQYVEAHSALPPSDWWGQSGHPVPEIHDASHNDVTMGTRGPSSGHVVTVQRARSDRHTGLGARRNGETPRQNSGLRAEEVNKGRKKNLPAAPSAVGGPPARAGTTGRPRWPDGPLCRLCGGELDEQALHSADPSVTGYCPTCRSW